MLISCGRAVKRYVHRLNSDNNDDVDSDNFNCSRNKFSERIIYIRNSKQ